MSRMCIYVNVVWLQLNMKNYLNPFIWYVFALPWVCKFAHYLMYDFVWLQIGGDKTSFSRIHTISIECNTSHTNELFYLHYVHMYHIYVCMYVCIVYSAICKEN